MIRKSKRELERTVEDLDGGGDAVRQWADRYFERTIEEGFGVEFSTSPWTLQPPAVVAAPEEETIPLLDLGDGFTLCSAVGRPGLDRPRGAPGGRMTRKSKRELERAVENPDGGRGSDSPMSIQFIERRVDGNGDVDESEEVVAYDHGGPDLTWTRTVVETGWAPGP